MASTIYPPPIRETLEQWRFHWRLQHLGSWMPRSLMIALGCCIALGVWGRFYFIVTNQQLAVIAIIAILMSLLLTFVLVYLRQPNFIVSARLVDMEFGLQERISTTLELLESRIIAHPEIAARQVEDTLAHLQTFDPKARRLQLRWLEWLGVALLAIVLILLMLMPNPLASTSNRTQAQAEAIESASEVVRDITEAIANNTELSPEERQALLNTLETTLDTLNDPQTTPEEAFAAMSDVQSELQARAETLAQTLRDQQTALSATRDTLRGPAATEASTDDADAEEIPSLSQSIGELAQSLPNLSSEELAELADALSDAAETAANADLNLSDALQSAAEALRDNDLESALESLREAQERAQQSEQSQTQSEQSQSEIQELASEAEQSAQELAQSGQPQEGETGPQSEEGNPQSGNSDSSGETDGTQGEGDNGSQPSDQQGGSPILDPNAQNSSQQPQSSITGGSNNPGGSGDGQAEGEPGEPSAQSVVDQGNNPDGTGQGDFEPIYAPQRIGGQGGAEIILEPDPSDLPSIEGEFTENPVGEAFVPYNEVFADYQNAANRALDSGYIPLGLRDVVRNYFTSLQPGE